MAARSGGLASWDQGEASYGVVVVGVALQRWFDGGQGSPELGKRVRRAMPELGPGRGYL